MSANRLANTPVYQQLRDELAHRIAAGEWVPTQALPSEGDLARAYGLSGGTVRKALDLLENERIVTRRQGRGTFVLDCSSDELVTRFINIRDLQGRRLSGEVAKLEITEETADEPTRARLLLAEGERVHCVRQVRGNRGKPFMVERAFLPVALFPNGAHVQQLSHSIPALAQRQGLLLGRAEERISAVRASSATVEALGVAPDTPLLLLDRVVLTLDGRPAEWRLAECNLSELQYEAELV